MLAALLALAACPRAQGQSAPPASDRLPKVPQGYGREFRGETVLRIRDRQLALPSGSVCAAADPACAPALRALRGKPLALELDRGQSMGELSAALAALTAALDDGGQACLLAADESKQLRCVPFRPFSGDEFGAWLDADKPLGKIRIILRADGMEVVADRGKVPGPDRFGPSLPPLSGRPDFAGLDRVASALGSRFPDEEEAALAPSAAISVEQAVRALSLLSGPEAKRFPRTYLVYP